MTHVARSAALAFIATLVAAPVVLGLLRHRQLLDHPNSRSSHTHPTPRGAGLALILGALAGLVALAAVRGSASAGLLVAAAGFGALGLLEDVVGVGPLRRLGAQLVLAGLPLLWLLEGAGGPPWWQLVFAVGCAVWLVAFVNAFNFMDGINGISAAQVLVAAGAWWVIGRTEGVAALANPALVIGAATLAFVPFNFPRARAFLGDVGSYFLGAWLAALVILGLRAGLPPEAVLGPLAIYLADTGTTIVRRVRDGEVWYLPHRSHVYQRLTQLGWSHTTTTLAVGAAMVATSALGAASLHGSLTVRIAADAALAVVLVTYLVSPAVVTRLQATAPSRAPSRAIG